MLGEMSLLSIEETALYLGVSKSLVYRLVSRGEIPHYEIASCKRIKLADLEAYLETRKKVELRLPKSNDQHF